MTIDMSGKKSAVMPGRSGRISIKTGIDILEEHNFRPLKGCSVGLLVNPASVNKNIEHDLDVLLRGKGFRLKALFGPQHGIYGNTQDNMIEWETFNDPRTGLPMYSLYGGTRKPTDEMLEGIDTLAVDLPDVGSRYYTFLWTAKLCLEACARRSIRMMVFDRPNPIGGEIIEGPSLNPEYRSFVGLSVIPIRHGMTMGELLLLINEKDKIGCNVEVLKMSGWGRGYWFDDLDLPWVLPSPNMPTLDAATVYPGGCLLEATNISEGRGTCRPFEIVGAPYIDAYGIVEEMNLMNLPGVIFRPAYFEPTFNKHRGEICGGFQMHITDREKFCPVKTIVFFISLVKKLYPDSFSWKNPPYEYEFDKMPIDVLWGDSSLRGTIDNGKELNELFEKMEFDRDNFRNERKEFLLYE